MEGNEVEKEVTKKSKKDIKQMIKRYVKRFISIARQPEMRILPGNLAFFLVLSFAPIVTVIAMLASRFSISVLNALSNFQSMLPNGMFELLQEFLISGEPTSNFLLINLIIGFVAASNGANSIIITSNTLYDVQDSNYIVRRIRAFFLTCVLVLLFIFVLLGLVFGNMIMKWFLSFAAFAAVKQEIYALYLFIKWPLTFFVTFVLIKFIYAFAPDKRVGSKNVTKGALFTTVGWIVVSFIYSLYANRIANYNVLYGSLSNIIILMIWIYIISYIFVLGISLNVSFHSKLQKREEENSA